MRATEDASSSFLQSSFIHPSSVRRALSAIIAMGACFIPAVSVAQQRPLPRQAESAQAIRRREEWFYQQRAYPHKHIPAGARLKAYQQLRKMQAAQQSRRQKQQNTATSPSTSTTFATALSSTSWTLIGPQPTAYPPTSYITSGRANALAVDPTNSNIVYLGGPEGGVWKTTDGGATWTPLTDNQPSLAIGSIAIDPQNPQTIYAGTGEENFSLYNYSGAGVLKSTDGGSTWTQLPGPFVGPFDSQSPYCGGAYIGSIAVDPGNSQVLLAGAEFQCSVGTGIYRSANGGASWTEVLGTPQAPDLITGLVFDPTNGNNVYAAVGASSTATNDGIWKSTNAGLTWTLANGTGTTAFPGSSAARISLAVAASSPSTLYAGAASAASGSTSLLGVYKTTNGGVSWTQLTSAPQYCSPDPATAQCYFDNVVAVAPNNPNIVLLGGSESATTAGGTLYLSLDGGATWQDITTDTSGNGLHPDMHAIAFSKDGSKMFAGNDGGIWSTSLSSTGIGTWSNLNQSLALTQFYPGMSMSPADPNEAFAGTQDNGVQEYSGSLTWGFVGCGDGGQTAFNPVDLNTLYLTCQYVPPNTGDFLFKLTVNPATAVAADNGIDGTDNGAFIPPLTMDPSDPNTLYFGTYRVYETVDGGSSWTPVSSDLTTGSQGILSTISTIAIAPSNHFVVYAGTYDGKIWESFHPVAGPSWGFVADFLPHRSVTAIAVDPSNSSHIYATFSGYSGFGGDNQGHVFVNNAGLWTDISGNLPNIPVNDFVLDPDFPNTFYVATDIGVFETTNGGSTWAPLGTGLPAVVIMSLKLQRATRILRAASYGRSAWDIQLPVPQGPTAILSVPNLTFPSQQVGTTSPVQNVILTDNGSATLGITSIVADGDFAETNTCGTSLAAGASCTISVTFTPTTFGSRGGGVTITDNASTGSTQVIGLSGSAFSGTVSLSPTSLLFGNQVVGTTSAAQTVTLTNASSAPLTITGLSKPSDFSVTSACPAQPATLAGGASCTISVNFSPTFKGTAAEQVTLDDSAADSPQSISVTGTSIQAVVTFTPSSLSFGDQVVGTTTSAQTATLTNTGTADLSIDSLTAFANTAQDGLAIIDTPSAVSETDTCPRAPTTIPPSGSCTITVSTTATMWGSLSGSIAANDNAQGNPQYLSLSETAYSGQATLSPTSLTFNNVLVGQTSAPQAVTLTNTGSAPLYVASISGDGVFNETDNCPRPTSSPTSLAPGASCTINVTFTAFQTPTVNGGIIITDSSSGYDQQSIPAYGTGSSDFTLTTASGTSSSATVTAGGSANYSVTVTPAGGFTQAVSLACSGAPVHSSCTVSPASVTLDGTNSQNVKVTVSTTAASMAPPGPRSGPPAPGGFSIHEWWIALLWLMMAGMLAMAFNQRRRRVPLLAGAVLLAALAMSCGGGGGGGGSTGTNPGTPKGTYTLTVTGTSGSLQHKVDLQLTVQ
jgi:Cep192 domain 4/HYDIN/CFA65/VesB-like, Ig-like domain